MNKNEMLDNLKAKNMKAPFRVHTWNGVHAIVTSKKVYEAEILWNSKVREGTVAASQGTVLLCKPTFTYAREDIRRSAHTCTDLEMLLVFGKILNRMYGQEHSWDIKNGEDEKILLAVGKILCKEDRRIYVPMSTDKFELIWFEFGKTTLAQAEKHLLEHMIGLQLIKP